MAASVPGARQPFSVASPFERLRALLAGIEPGRDAIDLTIGEPRHAPPAFLMERLAESAELFARYPPIRGTPALRAAIAEWLARRYPPLAGNIDADAHILPLNGSREGLFSAVFLAVTRRPDIKNPAVLIPNPFYQAYAAGALAAGAEPIYLPATRATGFLPDLAALDKKTLERTTALFLCSPANPQGAVADEAFLGRAIRAARTHGFMLFADECYSEIYTGGPPPGALACAWTADGSLANVVAFQSLSKRSNLPGLRSGFCAGDPVFIESYAGFRNVAAPQVPLPVQHASTAIWRDEAHVEASRALYREKFDAAAAILAGKYGFSRPEGGFFLWLDVSARGGGEKAAKTLWKDCGVKILPGAYLARDVKGEINPGTDFVRIAMVADLASTRAALTRMAERLG